MAVTEMETRMRLTAITGGIGAGKSVVSRVLVAMGYPVFDCDYEARCLMEQDADIHCALREQIHPMAVTPDGKPDRRLIAEIVFADADKLAALNAAVHGAVKARLREWAAKHAAFPRIFVETAILYTSGMDSMVDDVIEVTAPEEVRIARVMVRSGLTRSEVESRIASQRHTCSVHPHTHLIINDDRHPLLPQLLATLA